MNERSATVGALELAYLESGADQPGPPVLMLHGWPTNALLWRHVLGPLGEHRRCIALDLPGFGRSSKPLDASYSFRFFDRVLDGFLDALGISQVALVVHDLGGPVGLHWAIGRTERVSELVLLNTLVYPQMSWMVVAFIAATYLPGVQHALRTPWGVTTSMRFGVQDKSRIDEEVAQIYAGPYAERPARRALIRAAHGLHPGGFRTIAEGLQGFSGVPVHLLYGERDRILPKVARTMARVQEDLPHATLASIPDCGHFLQEDQPERVALELVERLSPS